MCRYWVATWRLIPAPPYHDAAARDYAHRMIRELKEGEGYDEPSLAMVVTNESGRQLFVIPFGFIPWRTLN
jgi:hypothetical protein